MSTVQFAHHESQSDRDMETLSDAENEDEEDHDHEADSLSQSQSQSDTHTHSADKNAIKYDQQHKQHNEQHIHFSAAAPASSSSSLTSAAFSSKTHSASVNPTGASNRDKLHFPPTAVKQQQNEQSKSQFRSQAHAQANSQTLTNSYQNFDSQMNGSLHTAQHFQAQANNNKLRSPTSTLAASATDAASSSSSHGDPYLYPYSSSPSSTVSASFGERLDLYFQISARHSTIGREIRGGIVTFVTMAYILVVNPEVLSKSGAVYSGFFDEGRRMSFESVATATALTAALGSAIAGIFGNLPFGLAAGMGLNSYFTYGVCLRVGIPWPVALTCVFFQGILFLICSLTGLCTLIQVYAPPCIKKSITVGLGLFQALIGFECMKLVVNGQQVLLGLGDISDPHVLLALGSLLLISLFIILDVKGAMLLGIAFTTISAWVFGLAPYPDAIVSTPTLNATFLQLDFGGYFDDFSRTLPITLVFLFVAIFDTSGVQFAAGQQADILDDDGHLPGAKSAFAGASVATCFGALFGTSPVIIHNETCAGIQDGARTGLCAVVVAICFLLSLPFIPILQAVPPIATAAPLILVGMFMMSMAKFIDWEAVDEALPAFLTATMLPFTYSIANGMLFGMAAYGIVKGIPLCLEKLCNCPTKRANLRALDELEEEERRSAILLGKSPQVTRSPHVESVFADPMPGLSLAPFTHQRSTYSITSTPPRVYSHLHDDAAPTTAATSGAQSHSHSNPHAHSYSYQMLPRGYSSYSDDEDGMHSARQTFGQADGHSHTHVSAHTIQFASDRAAATGSANPQAHSYYQHQRPQQLLLQPQLGASAPPTFTAATTSQVQSPAASDSAASSASGSLRDSAVSVGGNEYRTDTKSYGTYDG